MALRMSGTLLCQTIDNDTKYGSVRDEIKTPMDIGRLDNEEREFSYDCPGAIGKGGAVYCACGETWHFARERALEAREGQRQRSVKEKGMPGWGVREIRPKGKERESTLRR